MSLANGPIGQWTAQSPAGGAAALGTVAPEGDEPVTSNWDAMEVYFECITTCSLEDGECVTRCVEELRERA